MKWKRFLIRRIGFIVVNLLILSLLIFVIMEVLPGDLARSIVGREASEEQVQMVRERLGLDKPAHIRYIKWLGGLVRGDLGYSLAFWTPIGPLIRRRVFHSVVLGGTASLIGLPLAVLLGFVAGMRRPPWLDQLLSRTSIAISSVPEFMVAVVLVLVFAETLGWFPAVSSLMAQGLLERPSVLVLPVTTVFVGMVAYILRMTRACVIEVIDADYIVLAELKQLPMRTIMWRHLARTALLPTVTVAAHYLGYLMGGVIVIEAVFAYPGLGNLIYEAATKSDIPLLEAGVLLVGSFAMFANLGADILYVLLDPRVRES